MRIEISNLISLDGSHDVVRQQEIGDGVSIENLTWNHKKVELYELIRIKNEQDYRRLLFREQLEQSHYTHRFFISLDGINGLNDPQIDHAEQLMMRAIILARIVRPIAIPLHPTSVRCLYGDNDHVICFVGTRVGFYSAAYVRARSQLPKLTQSDAERMQAYWKSSQFIYDNRWQYLRIYRALYMFNDACHIRPLNIRHVVLRAVLESLICTSHRRNRLQVVQRLPQLTGLNSSQAERIYDLCADIKHSAAPNFLSSPDVENLTPEDQQREQATLWLEDGLCELFRKILDDQSLADNLAEPTRLRQKYPVKDKKGNLI
jgi:hypothetical protein